jgi:NHLM bacteriocin system ABC transporter peptidase/ATP-binding protein
VADSRGHELETALSSNFMATATKPETEEAKASGPDVKPPPSRRVKTPTVLQMEAVECGAAALAMVLGHFKRFVPLEELRQECGVSRDGSKASNVLKAARKYGLEAKGFKYDSLEKLYDLDLPAILFWNFNHFVVLDGFHKGVAKINDPAQGPRDVSMAELDGSYSGVVLIFKPGPSFKPGGAPPSMIPALKRRLTGSEMALGFVVLAGLFVVVPGLVIPTFTRVFIDDYLLGGQAWLIRPLLIAMALTLVVQGVLTWLQEYYLLRLETKLALSTSADFFNHILRLPAAYFGQRFAGEIGSRVQINDKVANVVAGKLATTVIDSVMTIFYAGLMFLYDVVLTLVVIGISLLNVAIVRYSARLRIDASRRLMQDKAKLMGTAMNGLQMIETLKATGSESEFFARWSGYHAKGINGEQFLGLLSQGVNAIPPFIQTVSTMVVLVLGGLRVMDGDLTAGMLVAYQTLLTSFTRPLMNFVQFGTTLQELEADMNRLDDVLRYPQDAQYKKGGRKKFDARVVKLSGHIEIKNLDFGYSPLEPPLVQDFNLTIQPGQRVALVGSSGSGKSTVAKVVSGLYEPWKGQVLFDGVDRRRIPQELLSNSVAVVDQEVFLFGGSITDNVTMWDPTITSDRVATACRDGAISDVIETRDGGYQAQVEEGGGNFSGGQCQRLEISRALVSEPTILILDEATSALDPTTEVMIDEAIRRRGCTCIIIAHRLSTIRDADEIIVMHRGKIVQRGTHVEMKDVDGPYKQLIAH